MLILHSVDDGYIPIEPCRQLVNALEGRAHLHEFAGARHCKLFNYDAPGYRLAIADFVERLA
jgi:hypothetical protein